MTVVWIALGIVGLFLLLWLNAIRATLVRNWRLAKRVQPAIDALQENRPDALAKVAEFAADPATRNHLFATLQDMGRADAFSSAYRSVENVAESDLVGWLSHANELGAEPAQMELVRPLSIEEGTRTGSNFLFRFRVDPSHWAFERGWMAGVAGPYWDGVEAPLGAGLGTFSELQPFAAKTEAQHVEFLQQALKRKGLVVRA